MNAPIARALAALRGNARLLANSSLLGLGSMLAAALGFVYWWFAAREFPPAAVGAQAALISTMALVGMFGDAGFGTLLLGEAGSRGRNGDTLLTAAAVAGGGMALLLGILTAGLFHYERWMTGLDALLFVIGSALTGLGMVIDAGFIGLGESRLQFARSLMFCILKLILLVAIGLLTQAGSAILLTWVISLAVTMALSCKYAMARGVLRLVKPDLRGLIREFRVVLDHHLLNLSAVAPGLLLPLVVNACLGPEINAAFYAGWMIRSMIILIPASLTTVLFSLDNSAPEVMRQRLRFSLLLSLTISAAALAVFVLFGDFILRMFNPSYPALAGAAMPMLGISLIGGTIRQHYVLLARVRRKMRAGAFWLTLGGCAELAMAVLLGGLHGNIHWLALGWVVGLSTTTAFLLRPFAAYLWPGWSPSLVEPAILPISHR